MAMKRARKRVRVQVRGLNGQGLNGLNGLVRICTQYTGTRSKTQGDVARCAIYHKGPGVPAEARGDGIKGGLIKVYEGTYARNNKKRGIHKGDKRTSVNPYKYRGYKAKKGKFAGQKRHAFTLTPAQKAALKNY